DLTPEQRTAITAVRDLHGRPIAPSMDLMTGPALPSPPDEATLLPAVTPEQVESMRHNLRVLMHSEGGGRPPRLAMTIMVSGAIGWEVDPFGVFVGTLTLDPEGHITATHLARPDFMSPRGKTYRTGVVGGGIQVPV